MLFILNNYLRKYINIMPIKNILCIDHFGKEGVGLGIQ